MTQVKSSKGLLIAYWIITALLCAFLGFAAFGHLTSSPEIVEATKHLDFPLRLMPFLGIMKLLAIVTILIGYRGDITVGAYAGVFFYGVGAMVTHLTMGDDVAKISGGLMIVVLSLASYFLWKRTRGAALNLLSNL